MVLHRRSPSTELSLASKANHGEFVWVQGMNAETHHMQLNTKISPLPLEVTEPQTAVDWEFLRRFSKKHQKSSSMAI